MFEFRNVTGGGDVCLVAMGRDDLETVIQAAGQWAERSSADLLSLFERGAFDDGFAGKRAARDLRELEAMRLLEREAVGVLYAWESDENGRKVRREGMALTHYGERLDEIGRAIQPETMGSGTE